MNGLTRISILIGLVAIAFLINPDFTRAQDYNYRGCAWPIELSPEGAANVQGPDTFARYWAMPFDTQYETMTIKGTYPNARYFSLAAYNTLSNDFDLAGHLYDAQIAPDQGSINPFVPPGGRNGTYTVVISRTSPTSGDTIAVPRDIVVWVVLRLYVADPDPPLSGQSLMGGVPLPTLIETDQNGASKQLKVCSPVNKWSDQSAFAQLLFSPTVDLNVDEGTPSGRLWFASPLQPPGILWPNPDSKYIMMLPGNDYQSGRIIVIHGKAPGFSGTFEGLPVWEPSKGSRRVDLRYWSLCHNNLWSPMSTVNCLTDLTTTLQGGYYTIVISDDLVRPKWLRPNINWLSYGDEQYPALLSFRNMLPAPDFPYAVQNAWAAGCTFDFTFPDFPDRSALDPEGRCAQQVMGDYYPVAAWCDKSTFLHGGWKACLKGLR